jgi:hypothetical protein
MHQKQLELLKLLRDATRSGRAAWKRESDVAHHTELAGLPCSLRFKHPLLAGDDGSDADAVEVTAGQAAWTFYSGTEGFDLVREILTAAYPEIREHNQQVAARLEETIERIRKHAG